MKKIYLTLLSFVLICFSNVNAQSTHTLDVLDYGNPSFASQFNEIGYSIDGEVIEYNTCTGIPSIHVAILDSITCLPWTNCNNNFGQVNSFNDPNGDCIVDANTVYTCRARPERFFIFRSDNPSQMQSMALLLSTITNGNYILIYTVFPSTFSTVDPAFSISLQGLGSMLVTTLPDSFPFIFFCKKGDVNSVIETAGTHWEDTISISTTFECALNGIEDLSSGKAPMIYPNPASAEFNLTFGNHNQLLSIVIYDATGRKVMEKSGGKNSSTINVKNLAEGFYFVRASGEGYSGSAKFLVMH
ncbi:hypothetical protein BH11BAC1_BH11BAC1_13710 [soil metagenome]